MSEFLSPLIVEHLDGRNWRVVEDFTYVVGSRKLGVWKVEIPAGFETDFASVPRALWWLFPPAGKWGKSAVVHDRLYRTGWASRAVADAIFLEAMHVLGVGRCKRLVMYFAVRLCGGPSYKQI